MLGGGGTGPDFSDGGGKNNKLLLVMVTFSTPEPTATGWMVNGNIFQCMVLFYSTSLLSNRRLRLNCQVNGLT